MLGYWGRGVEMGYWDIGVGGVLRWGVWLLGWEMLRYCGVWVWGVVVGSVWVGGVGVGCVFVGLFGDLKDSFKWKWGKKAAWWNVIHHSEEFNDFF